jgi:LacI family transcriptional regulator
MGLLRERGIRIPDDMAVVAYDEFAWSALTDPPITLLNEQSEEIGRRAAMMLRDIIEGQEAAERKGKSPSPVYLPEHRQQVPAKLTLRGSCGCVEQDGDVVKKGSFQAA